MKIPIFSNPILFDLIFKLSGFYKIYERWLESRIIREPLPKHIAIILMAIVDGQNIISSEYIKGILWARIKQKIY
jgi:hypothetical protein